MDLNKGAGAFKDGLLELEAMVKQTELAVIDDKNKIPLITDN